MAGDTDYFSSAYYCILSAYNNDNGECHAYCQECDAVVGQPEECYECGGYTWECGHSGGDDCKCESEEDESDSE